MRHKSLKFFVLFLLVIGQTGLLAQNLNIKTKSGTQATYPLKNIKKMSFSADGITVSKTTGDIHVYTLSSIQNLTFDTGIVAYQINASILPSNSGTLTGMGTYPHGANVSLSATASAAYTFSGWTENGTQISTNPDYSFIATTNRTLVAHFEIQSFNISASTYPSIGGELSGTGSYDYGETATLTVTENEGYSFINWTEQGTEVSANSTYSFSVAENRILVANFEVQSFNISASPEPSDGGEVSGTGSYNFGQTCNLLASPETGYVFNNWTEDGIHVSSNPEFSFTVSSNRTLMANFHQITSGAGLNKPNDESMFFPNPAKNILNIDLSGKTGVGSISILSFDGKLMHTQTIVNNSLVILNLSHFPKGIYLCRYVSATEITTAKINKQ